MLGIFRRSGSVSTLIIEGRTWIVLGGSCKIFKNTRLQSHAVYLNNNNNNKLHLNNILLLYPKKKKKTKKKHNSKKAEK